jgi:hypothetical protein
MYDLGEMAWNHGVCSVSQWQCLHNASKGYPFCNKISSHFAKRRAQQQGKETKKCDKECNPRKRVG